MKTLSRMLALSLVVAMTAVSGAAFADDKAAPKDGKACSSKEGKACSSKDKKACSSKDKKDEKKDEKKEEKK